MTTPQEHYERVLAGHYTWMFGVPFEQKVSEQMDLLKQAGVMEPAAAVDLGAGPGFQAIALARMGAEKVIAVDTSAELLGELEHHAKGLPVSTHNIDLMTFDSILDVEPDTIVCMGDTLTHLRSIDDVRGLFRKVADVLSPNGRLVLSWRDLSAPPEGLDRFIPLRQDDERIMTCFLEDQGATVQVHDLVYVQNQNGWQLQKSAYSKLKLSPSWVESTLEEVGLNSSHQQNIRGMTLLAAKKSGGA